VSASNFALPLDAPLRLLVYLHAVAQNKVIVRKLGQRFEHILVDEYQA
jgi:hypothetical protein